MRKLILIPLIIFLFINGVDAAYMENVYVCRNNSRKNIALTFDDGPHPGLTVRILDILAQYDIKATFFVIGKNVKNYPDVLRQVIDEGHEVGNHTDTHLNLKQADITRAEKEIVDNHNRVLELCQYNMTLLRPPKGAVSTEVARISHELDYDVILWSIDTRDWEHRPVDKITSHVMDNVVSGSIILFHDYISYKSPTPEALKRMIPKLIEAGYNFVTVSELLESN